MCCSSPGSSVHGILQVRILEWLPFSSPGDLPDPGMEPTSPALAGLFFTTESPGKPTKRHTLLNNKWHNIKLYKSYHSHLPKNTSCSIPSHMAANVNSLIVYIHSHFNYACNKQTNIYSHAWSTDILVFLVYSLCLFLQKWDSTIPQYFSACYDIMDTSR